MTSKPPLRHELRRPSMSAKTGRLLKLYEDDIRLRFAARTIPDYLSYAREALGWLHERGIEVSDIRTHDLLVYQSHLLARRKKDGKPYSVGNHHCRIAAIKSLFRFLHRRGMLLQDPAAAIEFPRMERRLPRQILTTSEVRKILRAIRGRSPRALRDRAVIESFYATGIRASELSNLTPFDVDTEDRTLRVVKGKGGKDRNVPLTRAAATAIDDYLVSGRPALIGADPRVRYLFIADRGGKLGRATLSDIVRFWTKKASIKKRVTCHTFRHSVATHLLKGRADIRHIQELLGHRHLSSTERYTHVEISDLRKVIDRAHPRGR